MKKIILIICCYLIFNMTAYAQQDKSIALIGVDNYIIKNDNSLWHFKSEKQYSEYNIPVKTTEPVKVMEDVKSVDRNCVLKQDNTLWEWRGNEDTKELVKIADDVKSMSSSIGFTLFIKQDNSLWGYGLCNYGELGQANANFVEEPVKIMNNVEKAVAGYRHTMILKTDGTVWTLGYNGYGTLGADDEELLMSYIPIKVMENAIDIYAGISASFAITEDNTLWRWGTNFGEGLGVGKKKMFYKPVKYMENVKSVVSRWGYNFVLKTDGSLWIYGETEQSERSYTENGNLELPQKLMDDVNSITDWRTVSWLQAMLVLKNDGSLYVIDLYRPKNERNLVPEVIKITEDVRLMEDEKPKEVIPISNVVDFSEDMQKSINNLSKATVIIGTSGMGFYPNKIMTCAEAIKIFYKLYSSI